jgi:RNA polymerase sigma-70 factor, ECF subfamily
MSHRSSRTPAALAIGASFDEVVVPHLDAAHRLAQWLMRNEHDAEDVVQDAALRAFRYFRTFTGGCGRAWFLRIVRNTCYEQRGRSLGAVDPFDEEHHSSAQPPSDPETLLLKTDDFTLIDRALHNVPDRFRRLLILRELEGLSYREVAGVLDIPLGTVMSGLSRARQALRRALNNELTQLIPAATHPRKADAHAASRTPAPGGTATTLEYSAARAD